MSSKTLTRLAWNWYEIWTFLPLFSLWHQSWHFKLLSDSSFPGWNDAVVASDCCIESCTLQRDQCWYNCVQRSIDRFFWCDIVPVVRNPAEHQFNHRRKGRLTSWAGMKFSICCLQKRKPYGEQGILGGGIGDTLEIKEMFWRRVVEPLIWVFQLRLFSSNKERRGEETRIMLLHS